MSKAPQRIPPDVLSLVTPDGSRMQIRQISPSEAVQGSSRGSDVRTVSPGKPTMTSPLMEASGIWRRMLSMMRRYRSCVYPRLPQISSKASKITNELPSTH